MFMQVMHGTKFGNHVQQAKLPHVEDTLGGDSAREVMYSWCRDAGIEPLQLINGCFRLGRDGGSGGPALPCLAQKESGE